MVVIDVEDIGTACSLYGPVVNSVLGKETFNVC